MHFNSFASFIDMGGYGLYVWSAFALTFFSMGWIVVSCILVRRKIFKEISNKAAREQRIEKAKTMENTL